MTKATDATACFHCSLPADATMVAELDGELRYFCCPACRAVASAIIEGGLGDYYHYRDRNPSKVELAAERFQAYDLDAVQRNFVQDNSDGSRDVFLSIGGIHCAACAWLIEHQLQQLPSVARARVNVSNHLGQITWQPQQGALSEVFLALHRIGYRPRPAHDDQAQSERDSERRRALLRIGIAGLGMMQVGMVGIALHAGSLQGIEANWQHFLRWISLLFAIPVIGFSALPFFINACRALRLRRLNMDVPVALALLLAFLASVFGTVTNRGEVYFDSISMFAFFLLIGRYFEMRARHQNAFESGRLQDLLPPSVERLDGETWELVPVAALSVGDCVRIAAGDVLPCDASLLGEQAQLDEAMLTGESRPVAKKRGDELYAGTLVLDTGVEASVRALGSQTRLAAILHLLARASLNKPRVQALADTVAACFVAAVLLVSGAVYMAWQWLDAARAFWVALSVLVVTCPCALSLATPAAISSALNRLRRHGFLALNPAALTVMPDLSDVVFDKTGTLTEGQPSLLAVYPVHSAQTRVLNEPQLTAIAATMEAYSGHPLARAFNGKAGVGGQSSVRVHPGRGLEAQIADKQYRFGRPDFAAPDVLVPPPGTGDTTNISLQLLSEDHRPLAWFAFADAARPGISDLFSQLRAQGLDVHLFSGDRQTQLENFVAEQNLSQWLTQSRADLLPEDKLQQLQSLQGQGRKVLMVGDGINDVPVLSAADMSIAMGNASRLAKVNADAVLLNGNLDTILAVRTYVKKMRRIIAQNFAWAIAYNIIALPAAAAGLVPPWLAAIGMSLSSVVVVVNSLRLAR